MRVHFTVPIRFDEEQHPLGCTPADWFDVEVPDHVEPHHRDTYARKVAIALVGDHTWCTTYEDGPRWDYIRARRTGTCQATLNP